MRKKTTRKIRHRNRHYGAIPYITMGGGLLRQVTHSSNYSVKTLGNEEKKTRNGCCAKSLVFAFLFSYLCNLLLFCHNPVTGGRTKRTYTRQTHLFSPSATRSANKSKTTPIPPPHRLANSHVQCKKQSWGALK